MLRIRTKTHPKRPGVFVASLEGRTLCASPAGYSGMRTPLADGARRLIAMGFPPATLVTLRHDGSNHDSFVPEPLANWAARAFIETANGPRLIEWKPFAGIPSGRTGDSPANTPKHPDDPEEPQ